MRGDLPSGTVTFLFTDVEGSTKLLHELGAEAYDQALIEHRRALREAFVRHGGVEVDTQGDAFFYAFPTAEGALYAAGEGIAALQDGPIAVRMGLHTGTPHIGKEGYIGDDVHMAARIAASAHGGQVILSAATAELVDLELTDLGEHRLKDIADAVPIYQLGNGSFPALKTISNTNLPRSASSFVGRDDELVEVLSRFEDGARLVTLTGPGGTGKTRLAIEAAATLVPEYKAGVFWIGLAALRDPALVTETIAQTLGAKDGLAEHIAERELLLLLDNLEQVIEAAPNLSELLEVCPNLTLFVTSRELLRIQGEVEYAVPPLARPEAVALFCERAQLEPSEEIAELCRRLDDLPLAVELAAARTSVLTPAQILERLSQRLDLLKGGRDADPRQATLRATIEWSHDLLTPSERQLFARLSAFTGGCPLEAAEEVCEADLDTLQSLVEKSLLRFAGGRYWMLETIREFAGERLDGSDEASKLERRHAHWYRELSERYEPDLMGPTGARWFVRIEAELDNIRAAVSWGLEHDAELAFALVVNTSYFWAQTGRTVEEARLLDETWTDDVPVGLKIRALKAKSGSALGANDFETMMSVSRERLDLARATGDLDQEAAAMGMLAVGSSLAGDGATARYWYEASVALRRRTDNPEGLFSTLVNFGVFERHEGDPARSRELLQEGLVIGRARTNDIEVAQAVKELGTTEIEAGAFREARDFLAEGFEISTRLGLTVVVGDLVFAVALLTARTARPQEGAVLFGACDAEDDRLGFEHKPELSWWWALRDELIAALGNSSFESLFAEGRALSLDDAVQRALACLD